MACSLRRTAPTSNGSISMEVRVSSLGYLIGQGLLSISETIRSWMLPQTRARSLVSARRSTQRYIKGPKPSRSQTNLAKGWDLFLVLYMEPHERERDLFRHRLHAVRSQATRQSSLRTIEYYCISGHQCFGGKCLGWSQRCEDRLCGVRSG